MTRSIGFLGFGYAVPPHVRTNDDPVFNDVRSAGGAEAEFFAGTKERRYLGPGEHVEDLMIEAGWRAIVEGGLEPRQIDRLYGYAFVSEFLTPNGLYRVHAGLGLRSDAMVLPLNCEFSNFITSAVLAREAIASGGAQHVLIACGAAMTQHVDYGSGHAIAMGDGAGAAVVGPSDRFKILDHGVETLSDVFDVMTMKTRAVVRPGGRFVRVDADGLPVPIYEFAEHALETVMIQGAENPPALALRVLARHGIDPSRVALIGHQPTRALMRLWAKAIRPGEYHDTYDDYGNLTLASVSVTFARRHADITTDYVVLLSPGTGTHFATLLIER